MRRTWGLGRASAWLALLLIPLGMRAAQAQTGVGPRVADARPAQPQPAAQPVGPWGPLPPELQQHTDQVLRFWEHHSGKIQRYRCNFQRWEYDHQNFHPTKPLTYARGRIMYARPDKGLFEVQEVHRGKREPTGEVAYTKQEQTELEKWICDGQAVFEFDFRNQRLVQRALPPEVRGQQIVEGPLPFLFGAKAEQIKERYWIRINPEKRDKFWLEAVPKHREDAANFAQVDVIIPDDEQFLPEAMILYYRGGTRTTFEFTDREFNWSDPFEKLRVWEREFYNPATPRNWKRFEQPFGQ